jgi:hypothetical protein
MQERVSMGELVKFDPAISKPNGTISSVQWKLGNDTTINSLVLEPVQHQFKKAGTYEIELSIGIQSTTNCNSASIVKKIIVNDPPVIVWNIPTDAALGDQLILDASKSYDNDGIIATYDWSVDGKKIGTTPIVTVANLLAANHKISLTITDNSHTSSQFARNETTVRINSKPNPAFSLPEILYENELVTLRPDKQTDADGDILQFSWRVNNATASDTIRMPAGRTIITLTANDGRNIRNSIDSVQKEFFVIAKPNLVVEHPQQWIVGTEINANQLYGNGTINFLINENIQPTWRPTASGKQTATITWVPKGKPLAQSTFTVTMFDSLLFTEKPAPQNIVWNPSNPTIILASPNVNRAENAKIVYEWRKGKMSFGVGKVVEGLLNRGKNVFTVRAIDQEMQGAHYAETDIIIFCE